VPSASNLVDQAIILDNVLVPDDTGVISQNVEQPYEENEWQRIS
jgi:hypothetical protein